MYPIRYRPWLIAFCAVLFAVFSQSVAANTLCVNPGGSYPCYSKIQLAVNHASANDVIKVAPGTYKEYVTIGIPLSIIGAHAEATVVDAGGKAHGFFVDGFEIPASPMSPLQDSPWRTLCSKAFWL